MTIVGENFGTSAADVTVTFNGVAATILSVTNTGIVAIVPSIPPGSAAVIVTLRGRSSESVPFSVLQGLPVITNVSPSSVRAGSALAINGNNFVALARVQLTGAVLEVLLDDQLLVPQSVTLTQVIVQIPLTIEPGSHLLRLRLGKDLSNVFTFQVEIFTVTGTYELLGTVTFNNCPPEVVFFPVGTEVVSIVSVTDDRPALTMQLRAPDSSGGGVSYLGTLGTDGLFQVTHTEPDFISTISGRFDLASNGTPTFTGVDEALDRDYGHCRIQVDFAAAQTSTTPSLRPHSRSLAPAGVGGAEASWGRR